MPREHLLAVLVATVFTLRARAVDDVLELFDQVMVNDLISKPERQSRDEKLRRSAGARNPGSRTAATGFASRAQSAGATNASGSGKK
ncbi:hypothetical protein [Nocardia sp. NPDC046763]|uniref:hypothetical protein n=1 Tax=Nocardia sp. NPDC046763 TaxID=3155256 RepID=UPI0033CF9AD9